MSLFNVGGNFGYALGPILVTPLVLWLGLAGGALAAIPALVVSFALVRALPRLARLRPSREVGRAASGETHVGAMAVLSGVIALRSVAWFALLAFVPLWVVSEGGSEGAGNRELSLMLIAGVAGTLLLGPIADRVGLRRTLLVTQALLPPLILVFLEVGGVVGTVAPHGGRLLRRRDVRDHDRPLAALPPAPDGYGERHRRRSRHGGRGCRGRRPRRARRLGRPRDCSRRRRLRPAVGVGLCLFLPSPRQRIATESALAQPA